MAHPTTAHKNLKHPSPHRFQLASICTALLLTSACGMATFDGDGELLSLKIVHPEEGFVASSGSILAEGTKVQMTASTKADPKPASITAASSNNKEVLSVEDFNNTHITFAAHKAGFSDIELTATDPTSQESLEDIIPLEVRAVASTVITDTCKEGVVLTNSRHRMNYSMRDADNKRLTGYGFYPISFEPAGPTVDQTIQSVEQLHILTGNSPGTFALESTLPTSTISLQVVEPADITTFTNTTDVGTSEPPILALESEASPVASWDIKAGTKSVCGDSEHFRVHSLTPDICTGHLSSLANLYIVNATPLKEGTCTLDVQLLDDASNVLQSEQFSLTITS